MEYDECIRIDNSITLKLEQEKSRAERCFPRRILKTESYTEIDCFGSAYPKRMIGFNGEIIREKYHISYCLGNSETGKEHVAHSVRLEANRKDIVKLRGQGYE